MGPQPELSHRITFGPFEFDATTGDLRKHGNRIRLQGQPLQILCALIERPGQAITRDELQRQLWSGTTFVDFEQGLNAAVNKLRQALSDSADQPRYVETLPGRGYRFIAPVQRSSGKTVLEMAPPPTIRTETARPKRIRTWLVWPAAAALAATAMVGYWLGARSRAPLESLRVAQFTVAPPAGFALEGAASRQSFALSPDGSRLAFTAVDQGGAMSVFVRDLNAVKPRLIPETMGAHTLFWPPDGRSLFLTAKGKLRRASLEAEGQVVLGETPSFLLSGAWLGPDRLILSASRKSYFSSPSGGDLKPAPRAYTWPQLLPGGKHLLYVERDTRTGRYWARVDRLDGGGTPTDLLEADSRVLYTASAVTPGDGYLLYIRAGNLLAHPFHLRSLRLIGEAMPVVNKVYSFFPTGAADFSVSGKGTIAYQQYVSRSQMIWVDRDGKQTGTIGPAHSNVKLGRLSRDGQRLAAAIYDVERGAQNLWIFDTKTGAGRQLTLAPGLRDAAVWSPDSSRIAYLHASDGTAPRIAIRGVGESAKGAVRSPERDRNTRASAADGNSVLRVVTREEEEVSIPSDAFQLPTDWSPDGRFIAFTNTGITRFASEAQGDVLLVDLARDRKIVPLLSTLFHETNAAFSPNGKWLTFTSNESGRSELYLQKFEDAPTPRVTGERHLVSRRGALAVRWRQDGKELFYLGFDGRVYAVPMELSAKPKAGPAQPLFMISSEARAAIHSITGFDVSADGQRFLIPMVDPSVDGPSFVVVQNWEAGLSRNTLSSR